MPLMKEFVFVCVAGPEVLKVSASTPDDLVLSHLDLKPLDIVTPSLRSWNLTGWDWIETIEKYLLVQSSILKWKRKMIETAQTSILKFCLPNLDQNY